MAPPPDVNLRNDITLRSTGALLDDICERAATWDARPEDERADLFLEWEAIVDRLEGVVEHERAGLLTADQQRRLADLHRRLVASRDTIERLGLDYPDLDRLSRAS